MNTTLALPCTAAEARALTDRIRDTAGALHDLLLEAYARGAWSALGYDSWRAYATSELSISQSRAYQLLDQARVIAAIQEAAGVSTSVEITEAAARDIKPDLPRVVEAVREAVAAGAEPAEAVREAVVEAREAKRDAAFSAAVHGDEPTPPAAPAARPTLVEDGEEDEGAPDLVRELEALHAQLEARDRLIDSLSAPDASKEVRRLSAERDAALGALDDANRRMAQMEAQARYATGLLAKIRKALGVVKDAEILPALKRAA